VTCENGATTSLTGISCGGGGVIGSVNTSTYGTRGTGTFPGQASTIYEIQGTGEQSGNGGLNNLGQPPLLDSASMVFFPSSTINLCACLVTKMGMNLVS